MPLVFCSLFDPSLKSLSLQIAQRLSCFRRRHDLNGIVGIDSFPETAVIRLARYDRGPSGIADGESLLANIEPYSTLSLTDIGTVALEAVLRENGSDIAIERNGFAGFGRDVPIPTEQ